MPVSLSFPSLVQKIFLALSSHHSILTAIRPLVLYPSPPFPPLLSQGVNSLLLCSWRTAGNNGGVGLVVVATGMRQEREREGDKEERQREKEQAQRGCWLLAGRRGSKRWLITLVSMHTAIKP